MQTTVVPPLLMSSVEDKVTSARLMISLPCKLQSTRVFFVSYGRLTNDDDD